MSSPSSRACKAPAPSTGSASGVAAKIFSRLPLSIVEAAGHGVIARTFLATTSRPAEKSSWPCSRVSLPTCVTPSAGCGVRGARPSRNSATASASASGARSARRSCSVPPVSSGAMAISRMSSTSPVSSPSSMNITATPVFSSPASIAAWIGAAPRQRGSSDACRFRHASVAASSTPFGKIWP